MKKIILLLLCSSSVLAAKVEVLFKDLAHPWSIAFLNDKEMLITERSGKLLRANRITKTKEPVTGVLPVYNEGQGGLLDVLVDVEFKKNGFIFWSFSEGTKELNHTAVARGVLKGTELKDVKVIWRQSHSFKSEAHFGSRLVMTKEGLLYVTMGERYSERDRAQDLKATLGKVVRIQRDGKPAKGNPFKAEQALPEIWSYGHRNIQGAALNPKTHELWIHEHGPRGGDEINIPRAGKNYGWPIITYGREYWGPKIGEGTEKTGLEQPIHQWTPSIAPSGMAFYTADRFVKWKGSLFVGALVDKCLYRYELDGEKIKSTEKLLGEREKRIRDARQGPDGFLYVLTDEDEGELLVLGAE